ncbi:MAG: hypothetical protein ACLQVL_16590 [Terriglobia bacterium]
MSGRKLAIGWLIAICFGGLAGALFNNWYVNRSTVIEYSVNRTVLGTDQTTVVPNFRIQVGDTSLQSLYIYSIKLQYSSGPELENAKVGVGLHPSVKLVGKTVVEKPSEAFGISCEPFETELKSSGATCTVRRFNSHVGAYGVSFAADADAKIDVSVDAKNTEVRHAGLQGMPGTPDHGEPTWTLIAEVVALAVILLLLIQTKGLLRQTDEYSTALLESLKGYANWQLTPPAMRAHFTAPPNGAKVPRKLLLSGTLENIPAGIDVWLVVETGTVYHPQHEALPTNSGAFQAPVIIGGTSNEERGREFPVRMLAVTEDVSKAFRFYLQDAARLRKWKGVPKPPDSRVLATLKVIRDDSASI